MAKKNLHKKHMDELWSKFHAATSFEQMASILLELRTYAKSHHLDASGEPLPTPALQVNKKHILKLIEAHCHYVQFIEKLHWILAPRTDYNGVYYSNVPDTICQCFGMSRDFQDPEVRDDTALENRISDALYKAYEFSLTYDPKETAKAIYDNLFELRKEYFARGFEHAAIDDAALIQIMGACFIIKKVIQQFKEVGFNIDGSSDDPGDLLWTSYENIIGYDFNHDKADSEGEKCWEKIRELLSGFKEVDGESEYDAATEFHEYVKQLFEK